MKATPGLVSSENLMVEMSENTGGLSFTSSRLRLTSQLEFLVVSPSRHLEFSALSLPVQLPGSPHMYLQTGQNLMLVIKSLFLAVVMKVPAGSDYEMVAE